MSSLSTAAESALVDSLRPRLHQKLQPLFDQTNRCLPILQSTCQQIMNLMAYSQPGHLSTTALLYSIGDLAIAYQAPDLHQALQAIHVKTKVGAERVIEETCLIGIPCLTLA